MLAFAGSLTAACTTVPPLPQPDVSMVRIHNDSRWTMRDVQANFTGAIHDYGDLPPASHSGYQPAPGAFRYARITATVNNQPRQFQPNDYLGETPLGPGRFTYSLDVDASGSLVIKESRRDP